MDLAPCIAVQRPARHKIAVPHNLKVCSGLRGRACPGAAVGGHVQVRGARAAAMLIDRCLRMRLLTCVSLIDRYEGKGLFLEPPSVGMTKGVWHVRLPAALDGVVGPLDLQFSSRAAVFDGSRCVRTQASRASAWLALLLPGPKGAGHCGWPYSDSRQCLRS